MRAHFISPLSDVFGVVRISVSECASLIEKPRWFCRAYSVSVVSSGNKFRCCTVKLPSASVPVALHLVFISRIILLVVVVVVILNRSPASLGFFCAAFSKMLQLIMSSLITLIPPSKCWLLEESANVSLWRRSSHPSSWYHICGILNNSHRVHPCSAQTLAQQSKRECVVKLRRFPLTLHLHQWEQQHLDFWNSLFFKVQNL